MQNEKNKSNTPASKQMDILSTLVQTSPTVLAVKPHRLIEFIYWGMLIWGLMMIFGTLFSSELDLFGWIFAAIGLAIAIFSIYLINSLYGKKEFDLTQRRYLVKRSSGKITKTIPFDAIASLQIIVVGKKYLGNVRYELNLVLSDGTRSNILIHHNRILLKQYAEMLADALQLKVDLTPLAQGIPDRCYYRKFILMGVLFIVIYGALLWTIFFTSGGYQYMTSANWISVPGVMIRSRIDIGHEYDPESGNEREIVALDFLYQYEFDGEIHQGKKFATIKNSECRLLLFEFIDSNPPESPITCLVNPDDPTESVIMRIAPELWHIVLASFATCILVGIIFVIFGIRKLSKLKKQDVIRGIKL